MRPKKEIAQNQDPQTKKTAQDASTSQEERSRVKDMLYFKFGRIFLSVILTGVCYCFFIGLGVASTEDVQPRPEALSVSHYLMGLVHDWNGDTKSAINEFEKASQFDKDSFIIHLRLGADYAKAGKLPDAIKELKAAEKFNPEDLESHYLLALIYSTQQDYDNAAAEYETILKKFSKLDPKNLDVYNYLGQLYYSQKKYDKAIEQFQYILTLEPKNADILFMLGSVYLDSGNRAKAMENFKKAIEIDPEHENSLNSLGYMYAEDGVHLDEAMNIIKKAIEIDPKNGAYLDSLGWVYYKKGMYKEALENLLKANEFFKDPVIFEHLGDVYYQLKKTDDAAKYWKKSLELSPTQATIAKKLDALKKGDPVLK